MVPKTAIRFRSVGLLTRVCFRNAVANKGGDLLLGASGFRGPTLAPAELVYICTVQVLLLSRRAGIAPPSICLGDPACDRDFVLSMHAAGHPEKSITLLRLTVVASSRLLLVLEGVDLIPVLSRLDPFPWKACD